VALPLQGRSPISTQRKISGEKEAMRIFPRPPRSVSSPDRGLTPPPLRQIGGSAPITLVKPGEGEGC